MDSLKHEDPKTAWHALSTHAVLERLSTDAQRGLTAADIAKRTAQFGRNELNPPPPISPLKLLFEQFTDFIVLVLIAAAIISGGIAIYARTFEDLINPIAILAIVVLNAFLGFFQEYRAERALAALRQLSAPNARVIRDSEPQTIPAAELVPGDLIELTSGDIVPADARVIHSVHLRLDESALTGESAPVEKFSHVTLEEDTPLDARCNIVHAGTIVVYGRGRAVVVATAMQTQLGKIARLVSEIKEEETPLQQRLDKVGQWLVYVSLAIVAIIFPIGLLRGNSPLDMFLIAVSLAVAAVPEGLAAVVTIALALGLRRMIRRNALIRKLPAVETLGAATVICTDKTGTLTESEMTVREFALADRRITVTGEGFSRRGDFRDNSHIISPEEDYALRMALITGALCNSSRLVEKKVAGDEKESGKQMDSRGEYRVVGDPTEGALLVAAAKARLLPEELAAEFRFIAEFPFDPVRKRMSVIYSQRGEDPDSEQLYAFAKGAPDLMLPLCTRVLWHEMVQPLDEAARLRMRVDIQPVLPDTPDNQFRRLVRCDVAADHGLCELNAQLHFQHRHGRADGGSKGAQFSESLTVGNADGAADFDHGPVGWLRGDPGTVQQEQEWRGRTVQDRHFRAIQLDQRVVNPCAGQGGHDMLDCADPGRGPAEADAKGERPEPGG